VSWSFSVRGLKPRDRDRIEINLSEPTLPKVHHSNTEEDHHGREEEKGEEEVEVTALRGPRIGAAHSVFGFRETFKISHSGRTKVRPLSF
jgi:dihydrodipicolinate reductase